VSVKSVEKDPQTRSLTMTAEFAALPERVWQVWSDPRQLERWWGPPTYPATVFTHDLRQGGHVTYAMTGPDGDKHHGWWLIRAVEAPHALEFEDGFGEEPGVAPDGLPVTRCAVTLEAFEAGTRMVMRSIFPTVDAMQQMVEMGMVEGLTGAVGQIDALLA
jgi:uncharacterized protein YndB with AHSA1/START domain